MFVHPICIHLDTKCIILYPEWEFKLQAFSQQPITAQLNAILQPRRIFKLCEIYYDGPAARRPIKLQFAENLFLLLSSTSFAGILKHLMMLIFILAKRAKCIRSTISFTIHSTLFNLGQNQ